MDDVSIIMELRRAERALTEIPGGWVGRGEFRKRQAEKAERPDE